jgi:sterol desaturase/sphingolipid hydroxylase (fatty acid hydroxylase superfamily)
MDMPNRSLTSMSTVANRESCTPADLFSVFVFICPMHKQLYLFLFVMVQIWTIFIHDGDMISGSWWEKYINSPAHHTLHHLYFTCNYGQVSLCFNLILLYLDR